MKVFSQLEKAQLENTTSDTASHPKGMITYRTDLNQAKVSNGTTYKLLIDEDSTQTLSNKTYASPITSGAITAAQTTTPANPSSGSNKLYFKADGKLYTLDAAGNEAMVGSGSGGVKNLITNGNADDSASSIFVPYADAAGTRPVDGTGGSPTVTTSVTTSSPLDGTKSYLLTKPASNVQGQGWAVPFSVDPAYRAKSLKISADFIVNSGTFVAGSNGSSPTDGDLIWTIYDVTNSQIIEPSNIKMFSNSSTISDKFEATFQSSATGTSYRLIAHVASTSALAFELKVDNITVSPQVYVYGTPMTDWIAFTPTGSFTNATYTGFYRQVGDVEEYDIKMLMTGTPASTTLSINLRSGVVIDTGKMSYPTLDRAVLGTASILDSGVANYVGYVAYNNTTSVIVQPWTLDTLTSGTVRQIGAATQVVPMTWAVNDTLHLKFSVPVVGRSASSRMSDGFDGRVIAFSGSGANSGAVGSNTVVKFSGYIDKVGAYNPSTGEVEVKTSGYYKITAASLVVAGATPTVNQYVNYILHVDGNLIRQFPVYVQNTGVQSWAGIVSWEGDLVAGQKIRFLVDTNITSPTLATGTSQTYLQVHKAGGSPAISASEKVEVLYQTDSGQSLTSAGSTIIYEDKLKDSHNAYNPSTGIFTAPRAGDLKIAYSVASITMSDSEFSTAVQKNGSTVAKFASVKNPSLSRAYPSHTVSIPVVAEDQVKIVNVDAHSGASVYASSADNTLAMWMN